MASRGQASLIIQGGAESGRTVPISGGAITMGRRPDNDVMLDDSSVSRRHALIMETSSGVVLRDLNSTNGTFVNHDRIGERDFVLSHGDRIRAGGCDITLVFHHEGAPTERIAPQRHSSPHSGHAQQQWTSVSDGGGGATELTGKALEVLTFLSSRKGDVVSRQDMARNVWPELHEGELTNQEIDKTVRIVRSQIEEDQSRPVHLVTVGEFGYMLL